MAVRVRPSSRKPLSPKGYRREGTPTMELLLCLGVFLVVGLLAWAFKRAND